MQHGDSTRATAQIDGMHAQSNHAATAQNHSNSNAKDQNNVPTDSKLE